MIKTKNPQNLNEYMILAENGIFFITITQDLNDFGKIGTFNFHFDLNETYFMGQTSKGAFEYDIGKFIVILNGSNVVRFIDRNLKKEEKIQIPNITGEECYCSLLPFPHFDYQ